MRGGGLLEKIPVQKLANVLYILVLIALACNVIAVYLVPTVVLVGGAQRFVAYPEQWGGLRGTAAAWTHGWIWFSGYEWALTLFLVFAGINTAVILWQARRVLKTVLAGTPFAPENAVSLRRAALCCFLIAAAALARVIFSIYYYRSPLPLATYNALFVPMFAMGGLLCWVCSALFRQAAEMKAENDLTI